jgi:hypothetical protein
MLFNKIKIDDFIIKGKYQDIRGLARVGSSSTAAAPDDICTICLENFSDNDDVEKLPCNVRINKILQNISFNL